LGKSDGHRSEESNLNDDVLPHSYVASHNGDIAGGCVVIAAQESDNDEETQPDADDDEFSGDEFSDDNSIVDAVIQLALAENCSHLDETDDDNICYLNSYVSQILGKQTIMQPIQKQRKLQWTKTTSKNYGL